MKAAFSRPVVQRLRRACLAFPETSESASWGHPNFRAGRKIFAAFEIVRGRPSIAVRASPADADGLLRSPDFFLTPYGRGLWVSIWADGTMDWSQVHRLLEQSYRSVANKRMLAALSARPSD